MLQKTCFPTSVPLVYAPTVSLRCQSLLDWHRCLKQISGSLSLPTVLFMGVWSPHTAFHQNSSPPASGSF